MANERGSMDSTSIDWSSATSQTLLPPRRPLFPGSGQLNNGENSFFSNWSNLPQSGTQRRHHQRTPSTSFISQAPAWVDDLLNDPPDLPPARSNHRRSSSDTLAFLDVPLQRMHIQNIAEEEEELDMDPTVSRGSNTPEKIIDEDNSLRRAAETGLAGSRLNGNSHSLVPAHQEEKRVSLENSLGLSDQDSGNSSSLDEKRPWNVGQHRAEIEVQSPLKSEHNSLQAGKGEVASSSDGTLDPKRAKRILANRQSAQRSRVRKLHYIAELERTVAVLQEEVSVLSPQVTYLDRHRALLNVDNSAMRQRIAILAQEKLFKDAHNEVLKSEVYRLRQLYQQQHHKKIQQSIVRQRQMDMLMPPELNLKEKSGSPDASGNCVEARKRENETNYFKGDTSSRSPSMKSMNPADTSNLNA
ncbi:hypothetical protein KP509_15G067000 [Ceratopteris richardii]|uniref:BZIP domain-containing protein n=1 Tax=Ceratopteris richardii TaxID=49495 RepID=A0A8T2T4D1_CERRI|nr:hypothetical protein KP509_15G067000 [Ceratopteris richardii]KAH7405350.1 hypothetical protein KP509_15G067000 [Ceratopteris richardii]KAH7405351.1 hypothetical protein KP509_15G067000 [Ceratopteris richardii]